MIKRNIKFIEHKESTSNHYRNYIFVYGIISVLFVLSYFQEIENYEECAKIIKAIRDQEEFLGRFREGYTIPTVIDKNCVEEIVQEYKNLNLEVNPKDLLDHSSYYGEIIIDDLINKGLIKI